MTVIARDKTKSFVRMPKNLSMSYEDTLREMEAYLDGKLDNPQTRQDSIADITELTSSSVIREPEYDPDATENSSSFGDTTSRSEISSLTSDAEVESEYRHSDGALGSMFDSYNSVFPMRKKKLTNHWRNFIRPLMWRCKWTELKIKELESQALKYTRELEANEQTNMLELHQYTSDFCSKSFPYFRHSVKRKPMKRRKRKRVENTTDISSYMSHHQLFSYLEKKRSDPDAAVTPEDDGNQEQYSKNEEFVVDDDWLKEGEDSSELILRQIETVQSHVHRLKHHLDMVMLHNGVKFSSSENLSLLAPYDAQASAAQSPAFSAGNGDNMSLGAFYAPDNLSDFDIGDLVLDEGLIAGYDDGTEIPDVIESTVGLLSAADVTIHQPQIVESGENVLDETLFQSQVSQDMNTSHGIIDHSIGGCQELEIKEQNLSSVAVKTELVSDPVAGSAMPMEKSTLKSCLTSDAVPKNKRKRGERKAAPGGWNLKCSGELDSN